MRKEKAGDKEGCNEVKEKIKEKMLGKCLYMNCLWRKSKCKAL